MHVASVTIFEGPAAPLRRAPRAHRGAGSRSCRASGRSCASCRSNQGRPVWVDDPHFNLEYHVRATALPPPGSEEQLKNLASRVFAQQLDRTKPLWEIWLVQGLERGDGLARRSARFALLVEDPPLRSSTASRASTSRRSCSTPRASPRPRPRRLALGTRVPSRPRCSSSARRWSSAPPSLPRSCAPRAPRCARRGSSSAAASTRFRRVGALARTGPRRPASPLNVDIGPHRRYDWVRTDLTSSRQIKDRLGGTVNDVVLAVVTGALRRFLEHRGENVDELDAPRDGPGQRAPRARSTAGPATASPR